MKLTQYMALALAMTAFAACSNEDELGAAAWENDPSAVHIQATVGQSLLARTNPGATDKTNQTTFNKGDQISVAAGTQNAVVYTLTDKKWAPTPAESFLKWKGTTMPFEAFYPTTEGTSMNHFTVPTDQSTLEKIQKADYMTFKGNKENAGNNGVNLELQRKTARIKVNLIFNSEYEDFTPSVTELKIKGYSQISNGNSSNLANFTPYNEEGSNTYIALVAPNSKEEVNKFFISFIVNEKQFSVKGLPAVVAGTSYTYNLTVGNSRIEIAQIDITPWNNPVNIDIETGKNEMNSKPLNLTIDGVNNRITTTIAGSIQPEFISKAVGGSSKLKVSGPINGADIKVIREAAGCSWNNNYIDTISLFTCLDLSDALIKVSDDVYCNESGYDWKIEKENEINHAMFYKSHLTSIILPSTVTSINDKAFYGSSSLSSCNIPEGVTKLGKKCFENCTSLTSITLPASLNTLSNNCFNGCTSLQTVEMKQGIQITSIPQYCFANTKLQSFTIPEKVEKIYSYAFYNVYFGDTPFVIPANVKEMQFFFAELNSNEIGGGAQSIIIEGPKAEWRIDSSAFKNCKTNKLTLDRSWEKDVTNQSTTADGKLQGDFKGGHFNEIVFTDEGTTPAPDPAPQP